MILINSFQLGGAEKLSYDLIKNLRKYKDCNIYICAMGAVESQLEKQIFSRLSEEKIQCLSVNKPRKKGRLKCIFSLNKIIRHYNIDIVHTNGQSPDFYMRLLHIINRKIKVVTTIHNTSGYSSRIERIQQMFTDSYVAVSKEAQEYAKNKLKIKKKIKLIENGIDMNLYTKIPTVKSPFIILTVARITEQKGYLDIIKMIAPFLRKHQDVVWKIYGNQDEHKSYYMAVKSVIKKEKIASSVQFMGTCIDAQKIYNNTSCFILASKYEGFGIVFIEAMAVGLPVFAHKVGCINDICGLGGEIFDLDQIDVNDTLEQLYQNKSDLDRMIEKNRAIIEKKYSLTTIVKQYYDVYIELMGKKYEYITYNIYSNL